MKRIFSLILALVMVFSLASVAFAASDEATEAADTLNALGLFGGVGTDKYNNTDYDLDRAPTRAEAVTMLVRLLGKEAEAKAGTWETPFSDVAEWAKPYVGYAYANNLTNGVGSDGKGGQLFGGSMTTTATQYLTFVLRALGYSSDSDFQWDKAWELTDELGITSGQYNASSAEFMRSDIALVSKSALDAKIKAADKTLLDKLKEDKVVSSDSNLRLNSVVLNDYWERDYSGKISEVKATKIGNNYKFEIDFPPDVLFVHFFPAGLQEEDTIKGYSFKLMQDIHHFTFSIPQSYIFDNPINTKQMVIDLREKDGGYITFSLATNSLPR